jgi:hypothetical protein
VAAIIAGKKAILLALAGVAAFFKKLFGRKGRAPVTPPPTGTT